MGKLSVPTRSHAKTGLRPNTGELHGTMRTSHHRYPAWIQAIAVCLLVVYLSVTAFANLFHNHKSLEKRPDCPACLWHQMSQEAEDGPNAAEQIASGLTVTDETPHHHVGLHWITCDLSVGTPIRAPPSL